MQRAIVKCLSYLIISPYQHNCPIFSPKSILMQKKLCTVTIVFVGVIAVMKHMCTVQKVNYHVILMEKSLAMQVLSASLKNRSTILGKIILMKDEDFMNKEKNLSQKEC
jgi:hypothetical protein